MGGIAQSELATERRPYYHKLGSLGPLPDATLRYACTGKRPKLGKRISSELKALIKRCWDQDPTKRPTFQEIVEEFKRPEVAFATSCDSMVVEEPTTSILNPEDVGGAKEHLLPATSVAATPPRPPIAGSTAMADAEMPDAEQTPTMSPPVSVSVHGGGGPAPKYARSTTLKVASSSAGWRLVDGFWQPVLDSLAK